jgi:carboxyl-terminal processing protease
VKLKHKGWSRASSKIAVKVCLILIVLVVVFIVGVNVGNGRIGLSGPNQTGLPSTLNYTSVTQEYNALRDNYDGKLTTAQILNGIKHGLADSANDPYTEYFTSAEAQTFNNELNSNISGIGAEIGQDGSGNIQIIAPIDGSPAAKAGLKAGELITSINGQSTAGLNVDNAVNKIRGKAGSTVTLGLLDGNQARFITITRQNITVPSVNTKILSGNIGYMQITTFADDTSSLAQKAAKQFVSEKVKGIVLDLRDDPGGLLSAAINVSSLWLPQNDLVLQEKTGNTVVASNYSNGDDILTNIPTVILINSGSASASEITTGALHDNEKAYVIGTKSYGKGVVQQLINLSGGAQLKVTIASWYRPDGQNINHKGITPDQSVNLSEADLAAGNDTQLTAAETYLNSH